MEDIPLVEAPLPRPHPDAMIEEASKVSPSEWAEKYKRVAAEAYRDGLQWLREDVKEWSLCRVDGSILVFQKSNGFVYRVHAVVKSDRADRYIWCMKDHEKETRLAWDSRRMQSVQQLETYRTAEGGDLDVVKSEIRSLYPLVFSNRLLLGVQSTHFNPEQRTHIYVFRATDHYYFSTHFKETVHRHCQLLSQCTVFVWVAPLEDGHCQLKMLVSFDPESSAASFLLTNATMCDELCERVRLWERVVNAWKLYYPLDPKLVQNRRK